MKLSKIKQGLCWLVALASVLCIAGCTRPPEPVESESSSEPSVSEPERTLTFINPLPIPTKASTQGLVDTGYSLAAREMKAENPDTVGWLSVPQTDIDEVVLWYPGDRNKFYLRRDFYKRDSWYGSYFADYRSTFEGGGQGMTRNTTIYGHSMEDNPDGRAFSQLKRYLDEDFAKANPYIYFSTTDEDMAWEIFAVFYATIDLPYNRPMTGEDSEFNEIIGECLKRSIYNYDAEITAADKILTLSTCCYNFTSAYPNNYRYVIMAKLVKPGQVLAQEASFTVNPSPKAP